MLSMDDVAAGRERRKLFVDGCPGLYSHRLFSECSELAMNGSEEEKGLSKEGLYMRAI